MTASGAMRGLDKNEYVFLVEIPPNFEKDFLAGRKPSIQVSADATAMALAGVGVGYVESIISQEMAKLETHGETAARAPIDLVMRTLFNPDSDSTWFNAVMEVVNNVTMLSIILAGAALIREREHGTIEHLLVMPVTPAEIMLAKMLANGLVIMAAAILSIAVVVQMVLGVPIAGSLSLFIAGMALYLVAVTGLGIMLATFANSMPQFTLLCMPVLIVLQLLSGSATPLDTMPRWLQLLMEMTPAPHFVNLAQAILFRSTGFDIVWRDMAMLAVIGVVYFMVSLLRFRSAIVRFQ